jgi:multicomponent K+:H+ antiporter subunit E
MTRRLHFPRMIAVLLAVWLLANESVSPGHILLACVLAVAGGWALVAVEFPKAAVRRVGAVVRLGCLVLADIVRSNIAVARIVLGLAPRPNAGFVRIKLELRSPYALAALACIITATPGTVWADFDPESRILTIHVLNLVDEIDWVRTIGHRYQRPLMEIFG